MAGIGRPASLGKIVKNIKDAHPDIPIQYHGHSGPGFAPASILEVAKAGAEYIDVGMEPLSWGTGHPDLLTAHAMLKDAGFIVPDINMNAYMKVRSLTQEFMDDFLGYYINPKNRFMNSLLIGPGLPGGMMGSLMADLEKNLESLNKWFTKQNKPTLSLDELLIKLFNEVAYVWPKLGYPPLVTPFSQYVKNVALFNVSQMEKDKERWTMIADNVWDMMTGRSGKLPGKLAPELEELANKQGREFYTGTPQDLYPDALDDFKKEMKEKNWDFGQDDEDLMEYAMHKPQYEAYKSGKAKADFEADLAKLKAGKQEVSKPQVPATISTPASFEPKTLNIDVNGEKYKVHISYDQSQNSEPAPKTEQVNQEIKTAGTGNFKTVISPLEGNFFLTKESTEIPVKVGDKISEGQLIGYIEAMKTYNAIVSDISGTLVEICKNNSDPVEEDDVLVIIK